MPTQSLPWFYNYKCYAFNDWGYLGITKYSMMHGDSVLPGLWKLELVIFPTKLNCQLPSVNMHINLKSCSLHIIARILYAYFGHRVNAWSYIEETFDFTNFLLLQSSNISRQINKIITDRTNLFNLYTKHVFCLLQLYIANVTLAFKLFVSKCNVPAFHVQSYNFFFSFWQLMIMR